MTKETFSDLESYRQERKKAWADRDGYTPEQRCAILLAFHGLRMELLMLTPKQTLRVLFRDGLIDCRGNCTKQTEAIVRKWENEDRLKKSKL